MKKCKTGWKRLRNRIIKEQHQCGYNYCEECDKFLRKKQITIDHIIPVFAGGTCERENLKIICVDCQAKKSREENLSKAIPHTL